MRSAWIAGAVIIVTIGSATVIARAAEIRFRAPCLFPLGAIKNPNGNQPRFPNR